MNYRFTSGPHAWLAMSCLLFGATANADVLVLKNGDRITGDVKRIWDAEVTIEPEYSDEFQVDLDAISHIESTRDFEVEFNDGRKLDAQLGGENATGEQVFTSVSGSVTAPLADMLEMNEPEAAFEWDTNIEVSASVNKGNTDSSAGKVRAYSTVKMNDHRHNGDIEYFRERLAGVSTKERDLFKYSYNYLFTDNWFFTADASTESDPIILLENRMIVSAGVGLDIWDTPRRSLSIKLGAGLQSEDLDSAETEGSVANWGLDYRQDFFGDDVGIFHRQSIVANLSGRENTSYKTTTGFGYELTDLFSATVSLDYNYETNPAEGAENADMAFLLGLAAEF
jgi:putative salt-induced outer membrane protein YdiY